MVQQNQFGRTSTDDPNAHLKSFLEIFDTVKMNGVNDKVIQLCLFSFFLNDKAKACSNHYHMDPLLLGMTWFRNSLPSTSHLPSQLNFEVRLVNSDN